MSVLLPLKNLSIYCKWINFAIHKKRITIFLRELKGVEFKVENLKNICHYSLDELQQELIQLDIPSFRAKQIFQWVFERGATEFAQMTNLPKNLQQQLQQLYQVTPLKIISQQVSKQDGTTKVLYQLADGETVEAVMMTYGHTSKPERITICVSTQVGCPMGCAFCATGLDGYKRNLTKGEIIGQILGFQQTLKKKDMNLRVTNVVYMGMGEPLLNYHNVVKSIKAINKPETFNISYRRITVSTCGLVPEIKKLSFEKIPIVLAISLHASNDELRNKLVPINKKYPINVLMEACQNYIDQTGRKITFEYILLEGKNDSIEDAKELAGLVNGMLANVNLIPYNEVTETGYKQTDKKKVKLFSQYLVKLGVTVVVREEKGGDISAACGQLRQDKRSNRGEV